MIKMAAMPIYCKKPFKILLLLNQWSDFNETWHDASRTEVLQCVYKIWPLAYLDLFYGKVNIGRQCIWKGKNLKMSFKVKVLQEMGSRTEY